MRTRFLLTLILLLIAQINLQAQTNKATNPLPTKTETATALKQALDLGVKRAIDLLSAKNGFSADKQVRIAFPAEIKKVDNTLRSIGMGKLSDNFIEQLNAGAEKAVGLATPIMVNAIKSMSFNDATGLLLGGEGSATRYFESKTKDSLYIAFKPKVQEVLDQYGISKSYASLMKKYNAMPFAAKANTNLTDYVTKETLKGLFIKLAQEENKIRTDAKARTTGLLQKVFGSITQKK